MIIKVKQKHIKESRELIKNPENYYHRSCPIALAIKDAIGNVKVGINDAVTIDGNYDDPIPLSRSAKRFIRRFDGHKAVRPFSFKLNYDPAKN